MAEIERQQQLLRQEETAQENYYDYEMRFVKQRREQDRINMLPRVIKPAMFAKGDFSLGELRIFGRYTVAPISLITCSFLNIAPGGRTERRRMIPSIIAYILEGEGECIQEDISYSFTSEDVVVIPPYTTYQFVAGRRTGVRAWVPQVRLWHGQGLLWQEQFELQELPEGTKPIRDEVGELRGYVVPQGTMGLQKDMEVRVGADQKREAIFRSRRRVRGRVGGKTKYDWFLRRLAEENDLEQKGSRVIRGMECPWESTRQGRLKFYISRWTEVAARAMDLMLQEIAPGEHSGEHRHIFEELILVAAGRGYDLHEGTRHPWQVGDLICIPPMAAHRHVNDGKETARLVSVWSRQPGHEFLGGIEQISNASGWKS